MKNLFLTSLLSVAFLCFPLVASADPSCEQLFNAKSTDDFVELNGSNHRSLRFLTLNTQGFKLFKDLSPEEEASPKQQHYYEKVAGWANTIADIDPDITVLQEVFSDYELEYLIKEHLNDEYDFYIEPGNDPQSNVAFLVKKNLNLNVELRTNTDRMWQGRPLFSRDAPVLVLRDSLTGNAVTALIGHHAKAQIDKPGDKKSKKLRTAQSKEVVKIAEELSTEFNDEIPIFVAGDFNADLHHDHTTKPLAQNMTDVFDLLARPPPQERRVTHSYFKKDKHHETQLDGIIVMNAEKVHVRRADVFRYRDEAGNEFSLPETFEQRQEMPSDHNPVWADVMIAIQ